LGRIGFAFRSFFAILFEGQLPEDIARAFGYVKKKAEPPPKPEPKFLPADGALQILGILQRDARLVDFLMEDISGYSDDQVGAAVRNLHEQSRESLKRYLQLAPVIDGVEGTFTKIEPGDRAAVKLLGNVPASGKVAGGTLRHKGWKAQQVNLPALSGPASTSVLAPAEVEVE
jgi:hypothetical protein